MTEEPIGYPLSTRVEYMRRATMPALLFSLAQKAALLERAGHGLEQAVCYLTGDGDFLATLLVDMVDRSGVTE